MPGHSGGQPDGADSFARAAAIATAIVFILCAGAAAERGLFYMALALAIVAVIFLVISSPDYEGQAGSRVQAAPPVPSGTSRPPRPTR